MHDRIPCYYQFQRVIAFAWNGISDKMYFRKFWIFNTHWAGQMRVTSLEPDENSESNCVLCLLLGKFLFLKITENTVPLRQEQFCQDNFNVAYVSSVKTLPHAIFFFLGGSQGLMNRRCTKHLSAFYLEFVVQ